MRIRNILPLLLLSSPAFAGYQYYYSDTFSSINTTYWTQNGSLSANHLLTSTSSGALISKTAVPGGSRDYEVQTRWAIKGGSGGSYVTYLDASSDASLSGNTGSFLAVSMQNISGCTNGTCSASFLLYKRTGGSTSLIGTWSAWITDGGSLQMVYESAYGAVAVYSGETLFLWTQVSLPTESNATQPGVGLSSTPADGSGLLEADLGPNDATIPNTVDRNHVGISPFSDHVELQWQPVLDDATGSGIYEYQIYRNGNYIGSTQNNYPNFTDETVTAGTAYTYTIEAEDFFNNKSSLNIQVTTAPSGTTSPREVGVRPTGSYWGGGGEQLDMRSGNLNFSIPLLKVNGRGWSVPFNLSYNSENWRQDSGGDWNLGRDTGFGYGWRLQGGSLIPIYSSFWAIDHYLFIDASGAEYRLTQNSNGIWTSKESLYLEYDAGANRLYFPDGTFWVMACVSLGTEQDAGTLYPTTIEDTNGNQISLLYEPGLNAPWGDSSSRMAQITDVMGSYSFAYNSDSIPHLSTVTSTYPNENYNFSYGTPVTLTSPFGDSVQFGSAQMLSTAANTKTSQTTTFTTSASGELTEVLFPYGGYLRWAYTTMDYGLTGGMNQREVQTRYLNSNDGSGEKTYSLAWTVTAPPGYQTSMHSAATLTDAAGIGQKQWSFDTNSNDVGFTLMSSYVEQSRPTTSGSFATASQTSYTWSKDSLNRPYISATSTTLDPGTGSAITKQTTQVLDQYGNVTSMNLYDFGSSSVTRSYTNTYLSDSSSGHPSGSTYNAQHIHNRLLTSTATQGTQTASLVNNTYDTYNACTVTPQNWPYQTQPTLIDSSTTSNIFRGNVTTSVGLDMTHTMCYDMTGSIAQRTDGGHVSSATNSSSTNFSAPTAITTTGQTTSINWTSYLGLSSVQGPNGDIASIGYDAAARPSSTTSPYGAVTNYVYQTTNPQITATVNGRSTQTTLDGFGRTISTALADTSGHVQSITDVAYAPCGCSPLEKVSQQSLPHAQGATVYWKTYTYDGLGRILNVSLPDQNQNAQHNNPASHTAYSYAGNTVTITDPAGNVKTYMMDAFGNLKHVNETDPQLGPVTTTYTYDVLNHLTNVSMPRGSNTQTRSFSYASGNVVGVYLLTATNPENGTVSYTYYADGTLATKTDAKGQKLTYNYDQYGRLTQVGSGNPVTAIRTYTYDSNSVDSTYSQNPLGRLTTVQYNIAAQWTATDVPLNKTFTVNGFTVTEMFSYTQAGQVIGKRMRLVTGPDYRGHAATDDINASWIPDNEGRVTGITYPADAASIAQSPAPAYTYTYNGLGQLAGMTDNNNYGASMVGTVAYNAAGQLTQFGAETRSYNTLGQLVNITASNLNLTYNYTPGQNNGKITSQTDAITGETVTYAYDSLNRLISAQSGSTWGQGFQYDGFGNLTAKTVLAGSVPTLSVGVDTSTNHIIGQSYDNNGNMLSSPSGMMLGYDAENRMTVAQSSSSGMQYAYDEQNKRIWGCTIDMSSQQCTGQQTVYFYGPSGKLLAQFNAMYTGPTGINGNLTPTLTMGTPFTRLYFGSRMLGNEDRLGSRGRYYPYGEDRPPSGQQNPGDGGVTFATYTRDSATGLNYADQRYYATGWGRFVSPDPFMASGGPNQPQSWNRYSYAQAEPVNDNDRHGLLVSAESCIGDPDSCEAEDGEGTDINISGVGSEGGSEAPVCAAWWLDYTEGEGIPSGCPTGGAPPPPPPASLTCQYDGKPYTPPGSWQPVRVPNGRWGEAFVDPFRITFTASGGNGTYTWSITQSVTTIGTVTSAAGTQSAFSTGLDSNVQLQSKGPRASFSDAPGVFASSPTQGELISANFTEYLTTTVTVSDGDQFVVCPQVMWKAVVNVPVNGAASGRATVTGVITP